MKIGIPKEIKNQESRVAITPTSVSLLIKNNIEVLIENNAGINCGYTNEDYKRAGATITNVDQVWDVDLLLKVKEPQESEYKYFKKGLIIWGFLHLAASNKCVDAMLKSGVTAIAGETVFENGELNLLRPVSQIAGRRSLFIGLQYLEYQYGAKGMLLTGIDGVNAGKVVVFGGGVVGESAADMALRLACDVTIIEKNIDRINQLKDKYPKLNVIESSEESLHNAMKDCDILISTILIPGSKPPKLVKEYMIKDMKNGGVVVDVSIDQGGTVETVEHYTTHDNPIFIKHGIVHYAVPNMPGAVPITAVDAIQGCMKYLIEINEKGLDKALSTNPSIKSGLQIMNGSIVYENLKKSYEEK